jgi:predicted metal-dependent hydrolase
MSDLASSLHHALNHTKQFLGLSKYRMIKVKSNIDGQMYNVRDMADRQEAADLMAKTRLKMKRLKIYVENKFPDKPQVKQLAKNFDADAHRLGESTPDDEFTSFSVNKGESVQFCLRQRDGSDESLVNENIIMFVAIHEMGHIITPTVGHGPDFWNNFAWLLEQAETLGVYTPQNFSSHPVAYCGMKITDEPKYDASKDASDFSVGKITK